MAHEMREKRKRIARTTRATNPVCWRMPIMSVARIVVKRRMMCPSAKVNFFLGVKTVTHAPNTRNQFDAQVSHPAAYEETGVVRAPRKQRRNPKVERLKEKSHPAQVRKAGAGVPHYKKQVW
jgi:hypothetical protein